MRARLRVGVNLTWLVPGVVGGSEESTVRTLHAVVSHASDDVELVLFGQSRLADAHPDLVASCETHLVPVPGGNRVLRVAAEHTWLRRARAGAALDVFHDAGGTSAPPFDVPRVLTVHDIQPLELPENFHPVKVAHLRRAVPAAVGHADVVVVPSSFVRDRLVVTLGCRPESVTVVPWPVPPRGRVRAIETVRARWGILGPFLVLPAITYPHKDHVVAVRAMQHLRGRHPDLRLVLTGGEGPAEQAVLDEVHDLGLDDVVIRTGRVPASALAALYAHAEALVWPSIYEGFGNPVLEAMAAGLPVIAADAGASSELVAGAGVLVAPGDHAQLAVEVHRVLTDDAHRRRLVDAGRERAGRHTPERSAEGLVAAYRSACASL